MNKVTIRTKWRQLSLGYKAKPCLMIEGGVIYKFDVGTSFVAKPVPEGILLKKVEPTRKP